MQEINLLDDEIFYLELGCALYITGMICLSLIIPSFIFLKELKAHPGSLILAMCFSELIIYYGSFWILLLILELAGESSLNIFHFTSQALIYLSDGLLAPAEETLFKISISLVSAFTEVSFLYYGFISIDVLLLLRNPFYSPHRRTIFYHILAFTIPFLSYIPLRLTNKHQKVAPGVSLPVETESQSAQYLDMVLSTAVLISCIFSLIYSCRKISKFTIDPHHRKLFLFKTTAYTVIGMIYCVISILQDVFLVILGYTLNYRWLITYVGCSIILSLCGIAILPIRLMEPGVWSYITFKLKLLCCKLENIDPSHTILLKLQKTKSYYSFVHTALNGELAEGILQGITFLTRQSIKSSKITLTRSKTTKIKLDRANTKKVFFPPRTENMERIQLFNDGSRPSSERSHSVLLSTESLLLQNDLEESKTTILSTFTCKNQSIDITEYSPKIFQIIRNKFNIGNSDLLYSVDPINNESSIFSVGEGEGKSGSYFIFSFDKQFIIKTISPGEMRMFIKLLNNYYKRVTSWNKSLLAKIYGAYSVKMSGVVPVYVILMQNSLPPVPGYDMEYIFDIKGSLLGRYSPGDSHLKHTLKDVNFLKLGSRQHFLNFNLLNRRKYLEVLNRDIEFLQRNNIMDYSLLFGIGKRDKSEMSFVEEIEEMKYCLSDCEEYIYYFCIIDFFQVYTLSKMLETSFKSIRQHSKAQHISCLPPKKYADRFSHFISKNIFSNNQLNLIYIYIYSTFSQTFYVKCT